MIQDTLTCYFRGECGDSLCLDISILWSSAYGSHWVNEWRLISVIPEVSAKHYKPRKVFENDRMTAFILNEEHTGSEWISATFRTHLS